MDHSRHLFSRGGQRGNFVETHRPLLDFDTMVHVIEAEKKTMFSADHLRSCHAWHDAFLVVFAQVHRIVWCLNNH